MTRDEYKVKLKLHLLFLDGDTPNDIKWFAVDYDSILYGYSEQPNKQPDISVWQRKSISCSMKRFGEFFIDSGESLISIEELFGV